MSANGLHWIRWRRVAVARIHRTAANQFARDLVNVQGPVVQKPINANPRIKINQGLYFFTPKCGSTLIFDKTLL